MPEDHKGYQGGAPPDKTPQEAAKKPARSIKQPARSAKQPARNAKQPAKAAKESARSGSHLPSRLIWNAEARPRFVWEVVTNDFSMVLKVFRTGGGGVWEVENIDVSLLFQGF